VQDAFTLAVVWFVDDSDLFHMAIGMPSDKKFLQLVQNTTNNWAGLVHATGGLLKPQKFFWYMLGWVWKKGKAHLKTLYELPQDSLYIPQQDSTRVPISLKAISDPEKKFGVYMLLPIWSQTLFRNGDCPYGNYFVSLSVPAWGLPVWLWGLVFLPSPESRVRRRAT
jgi:hypothetical protein